MTSCLKKYFAFTWLKMRGFIAFVFAIVVSFLGARDSIPNNSRSEMTHSANASMTTTNISGVINDYAEVLDTSCPINGILQLDDASAYSIGDKVLLIQMKGATIDQDNSSAYGTVTDYAGAGLYEVHTINRIIGDFIEFQHQYSSTFKTTGLLQLVRIPEYVTANVTGTLTAQAWDGSTGGVLIFFADDVTLNANIDVSGLGFRGGELAPNNNAYNRNNYYYTTTGEAGGKGEGIAHLISGQECGRGALASGGGGGNASNAAGGGGSNYGTGGIGGYYSGNVNNNRGEGGRALTNQVTEDRVYLGGGGGAGHQNDALGAPGANGGGIVIIKSNTLTGNGLNIIAQGNTGLVSTGDGLGGGGAGGSLLLDIVASPTNVILNAQGGDGASPNPSTTMGGGGGGGGGLIYSSTALAGSVTTLTAGGANGVNANGQANSAGPGSAGLVSNGLTLIQGTIAISSVCDADGDGIINGIDLDDDNDGLLDTEEGLDCTSGLVYSGGATSNGIIGAAGTYEIQGSWSNHPDINIFGITANVINNSGNGGSTPQLVYNFDYLVSEVQLIMADLDGQEEYNLRVYDQNANLIEDIRPFITHQGSDIMNMSEGGPTQSINFRGANNTGRSGEDEIAIIRFDFPMVVSRIEVDRLGGNASGGVLFAVQEACEAVDWDQDGIPDHQDLDSDNDGCLDVSEAAFTDDDGDGKLGLSPVTVDLNGLVTSGSDGYTGTQAIVRDNTRVPSSCGTDPDADGITNISDLDDDNDGLLDDQEIDCSSVLAAGWWHNSNLPASNINTSVLSSATDESYGSGFSNTSLNFTYLNVEGVEATQSAQAMDIGEYVEYSFTTEAYTEEYMIHSIGHFHQYAGSGAFMDYSFSVAISDDGFNTWQYLLLDETMTNALGYNAIDVSQLSYELRPSNLYTVRTYIYDVPAANAGQATYDDFTIYACSNNFDADNDGLWNLLEIDSDGDGCYDVSEAGFTDDNGDGLLGPMPVTVDGNGLVTSGSDGYTGTNSIVNDPAMMTAACDTDGDGVSPSADLDDDNDGILDTDEGYTISSPVAHSPVLYNQSLNDNGPQLNGNLITAQRDCLEPFTADYAFTNLSGGLPNLTTNGLGNRLDISYYGITGSAQFTYTFSEQVDVVLKCLGNHSTESITFITPYDNIVPGPGSTIVSSNPVVWHNGNNSSTTSFEFSGVTEITLGIRGDNLGQVQEIDITYLDGATCADTDGDSIPDHLDPDSDNDGCPDVTESGGTDTNGDGILDGDGVNTVGQVTSGGTITDGYDGLTGNEVLATRVNITQDVYNQTTLENEAVTFTINNVQATSTTDYTGTAPNTSPNYTGPSATDASAGLNYQWYLGNPDSGGTPIAGETNDTLTFTPTLADNGNQYCVLITHDNNACIREISCGTLTVEPNLCDPILSGLPDTDNDGVTDYCDQDDDNDGILDSDEGYITQVFNYTGSDQTFTVPANVTEIEVKVWGAGGGGAAGIPGGAGGFVSGFVPVTPGQQFTVVVGEKGFSRNENAGGDYGFGGTRGSHLSGGEGGGLSGLFTGTSSVLDTDQARAVIIAGGGGGSRNSTAGNGGDSVYGGGMPNMRGETDLGGGSGAGAGYEGGTAFSNRLSLFGQNNHGEGGTNYLRSDITNSLSLASPDQLGFPPGLRTLPPRITDYQYVTGVGRASNNHTQHGNGRGMIVINYSLNLDTDTDGVDNYLDPDSDGDGCYDVVEATFTDFNNDGQLGNNPITVDANGRVTSGVDGYTSPGTDYLDPAILACVEICANGIDDNGDGQSDELYPAGVADNLLLWLKADEGFTGAVWEDQSSLGNDATANGDPTTSANNINFNPGISFDGDDYFTVPLPELQFTSGTHSLAVFVVYIPSSNSSTLGILGNHGASSFNQDFGMSTGSISTGTGSASATQLSGQSPHIVTYYVDEENNINGAPLSTKLYHNGLQINDVNYNEGSSTVDANLHIGKLGASASDPFFLGDIYEVIVYYESNGNEAISASQRQQIETYLAIRYGIGLSNDYLGSQ